jgi:thioredoxin reductase (NADPH)
MADTYDLVIIGGGPAGIAAGIYAGRARMKALLVERLACGGQILTADLVENFPGFPDGVKGPELAEAMAGQMRNAGLQETMDEARSITLKGGAGKTFAVTLAESGGIECRAVIIATGAKWNTLGIPGERELAGKGVSYCATCDGPLFRGKSVVVVGGGDTALEDALFLTRFADRVTVVHRRGELRAVKILQERAFANKKIEFCFNSVAAEIAGKKKVEAVKVKDVSSGAEKTIETDGVFVFVGITPNSDIVKGIVKLDEKGYVVTDDEMRTSVDGIFAAGDVRKKTFRQVVTAAGDGAIAAESARHYVDNIKGVEYR